MRTRDRRSIPLSLVSLLALAPGSLAGTVSSDKKDPDLLEAFAIGQQGRVIILPVTIEGKDYPFVFDTGSSHTLYDTTLKPYLGKALLVEKSATAGGVTALPSFRSTPAYLGKLDIQTNEPVFCLDLEGIRRACGRDIRGVIGAAVLRAYVVQIEFDRGRFLILRPASREARNWGEPMPLQFHRIGVPFIEVTILPRAKANFVVDTGDNSTGSIREVLFRELLDKKRLTVVDKTLEVTAGGEAESRVGQLTSFAVGPFVHHDLRFNEGSPSSIGLRYLSRYRVTMDLPNKVLYLKKGKRYAEPNRRELSGLKLQVIDGQFVVHSVDQGEPADLAGIRAGDVISQIQSRRARDYELFELYRHVFVKQGKTIKMMVKRGGDVIPVSFVLRRTETERSEVEEATSTQSTPKGN